MGGGTGGGADHFSLVLSSLPTPTGTAACTRGQDTGTQVLPVGAAALARHQVSVSRSALAAVTKHHRLRQQLCISHRPEADKSGSGAAESVSGEGHFLVCRGCLLAPCLRRPLSPPLLKALIPAGGSHPHDLI